MFKVGKCGDNGSDGRCETFRKCRNPRPWKRNEIITRHGLLMCQTCKRIWCRDNNSSMNILKIIQYHAQGKERPKYLQRGKHNDP